jgi:hypothetical protein
MFSIITGNILAGFAFYLGAYGASRVIMRCVRRWAELKDRWKAIWRFS